MVAPQTWKKELKISSKEDSLKAIKELYPDTKWLKKDHNLAEAVLIAMYGIKEREKNDKNDL
jgi:hypothetical protein